VLPPHGNPCTRRTETHVLRVIEREAQRRVVRCRPDLRRFELWSLPESRNSEVSSFALESAHELRETDSSE